MESVEEWVGKKEARRADKELRRGCLKVGVLEVGGAMGVQVEEGGVGEVGGEKGGEGGEMEKKKV